MLFVPASMPTTQAQDVLCFGAIIDLNKVYYSPTDDVEILISAPDFNKKPNMVEYIGTDANSRVTIITSQGTLDFYKLGFSESPLGEYNECRYSHQEYSSRNINIQLIFMEYL